MPQEPKKRHSRQRQGKRRANISLSNPAMIECANCGGITRSHTICPACGHYKGRQFVSSAVSKDKDSKNLPENENPA